MTKSLHKIIRAAITALVLAIAAALPAICVYIDLKILNNGIAEISLTEITQESMLLLSALIFLYGSYKKPSSRGFLLLAGGFFICIFIREMDQFLDEIQHGFWVYPALSVALCCILFARLRFSGTTLEPLGSFIDSKSYVYILVGLITLLVLSRTFGSGNLLWNHLLPADYAFNFKTAVQEGLELYSYGLILYGSLLFWRYDFN